MVYLLSGTRTEKGTFIGTRTIGGAISLSKCSGSGVM